MSHENDVETSGRPLPQMSLDEMRAEIENYLNGGRPLDDHVEELVANYLQHVESELRANDAAGRSLPAPPAA